MIWKDKIDLEDTGGIKWIQRFENFVRPSYNFHCFPAQQAKILGILVYQSPDFFFFLAPQAKILRILVNQVTDSLIFFIGRQYRYFSFSVPYYRYGIPKNTDTDKYRSTSKFYRSVFRIVLPIRNTDKYRKIRPQYGTVRSLVLVILQLQDADFVCGLFSYTAFRYSLLPYIFTVTSLLQVMKV